MHLGKSMFAARFVREVRAPKLPTERGCVAAQPQRPLWNEVGRNLGDAWVGVCHALRHPVGGCVVKPFDGNLVFPKGCENAAAADLAAAVPPGRPKIAQRFSAGWRAPREKVPQGRQRRELENASFVPDGTRFARDSNPALSRNDAVAGPPPSRRLTALAVGEVNSHPRFWFTIQ